ncbi:MAG: Na+/H+ antiporter subunit E [Leptospira sp.]|nr:Na+/H+ antiporter subunit E [Leptospira sp.]
MTTTKTSIKNLNKIILIKSILTRFILFGLGWIVLLEGEKPEDIWFVVGLLAVTTTISIYSMPPGRWILRPKGFLRFSTFFFITALRGGWDVARRAYSKTVPTNPEFITIPNNPDPLKNLILSWVISLLPGTASCEIGTSSIIIHVLDKNIPVEEEIQQLQTLIDNMFRIAKK